MKPRNGGNMAVVKGALTQRFTALDPGPTRPCAPSDDLLELARGEQLDDECDQSGVRRTVCVHAGPSFELVEWIERDEAVPATVRIDSRRAPRRPIVEVAIALLAVAAVVAVVGVDAGASSIAPPPLPAPPMKQAATKAPAAIACSSPRALDELAMSAPSFVDECIPSWKRDARGRRVPKANCRPTP